MALTKIPGSLLDTASGINGLIYPTSDGTAGQFLKTDGSGNLSFATVTGYTDSDVETYLDGGTSTPTFSTATVSGTLTVVGDLDLTGDINSYNVTDLDITDQTITLGAGQTEALSGGSGIIVDGSGASILWDETNTEWDFNNPIHVNGGITFGTADSTLADNNIRFKSTGAAYIDHNTVGQDINFRVSNASSLDTTALTIDSSGNVGIATSSPTSTFTVMGNNTGYVASNGSAVNGLHVVRTSSYGENIYLYTTDGNAIGWSGIGNVGRVESYGNNAFEIGSQQNAPIIIGTNDTEKLRVQNSLNHNGNTHYSVSVQGGLAIVNGGTISPSATGAGQLTIESNGYHGYIAVDGTGMHLGNNSTGRTTTLDVNETTVLSASYSNNGNRVLVQQTYGGAQWPSNPTGMSRPEYALGIINTNSSYSGNYVTMAFMTEPTAGNQGYAFIGAVDRGAENSDLVFGSRISSTGYSEFFRIANDGVVSAGSSTSHRGSNIINWTARNWIGITGDLPGYSNTEYPVLKTPYDYMYISVNGSYSAYIAGNGSYTANSDERLKTNITTLPSGQLDKVANLRGVNFEWLDTNRGEGQQLGVIAQEIEAEYPELVTEGVEDIKGVNYAGLVVPLIEAIKELKTELDAAKARITELENA